MKVLQFFLFFLVSSLFAGTSTTTTDLYRPSVGEVGYGVLTSGNFTKIDDIIGAFRATCPSGAAVGDAVYISGSGTVALSLADDPATARVDGIIYNKIDATTARIQTVGRREGLSGLSAGSIYYLSAAVAGEYTATPPSAPNRRVIVGVALSTTVFVLSSGAREDVSATGTFQAVYDNDSNAAAFQVGVGGSFAVETNGGDTVLQADDDGVLYVENVKATSGNVLNIDAASGQDISLDTTNISWLFDDSASEVLIDEPIKSSDTGPASLVLKLGDDGDSGFGGGDPQKEPALFMDGTRRLWVDEGESSVVLQWPLSVGHTAGSPEVENAHGKLYINGIAGSKTFSIEARTSAGADSSGRDNLYLYGPGDPENPHSEVVMTLSTEAILIVPDTEVSGDLRPAKFGFQPFTELTIAAGSVTQVESYHTVDTQDDDPSDNLDAVVPASSVTDGSLLVLRAANGARTVVLKHNIGANGFLLNHDIDFPLDDTNDIGVFIWDATATRWVQLARREANPGYIQVFDEATDTMADADYALIDNMTSTPPAGVYLVTFSSSANLVTVAADSLYTYAIFEAGSIVQHSERTVTIDIAGGAIGDFTVALHTQAILTLDGTEAVTVQLDANSLTSVDVYERSLILTKLN